MSQQRLGHAGAQQFSGLAHFRAGLQRARPDQHGDPFAVVEDVCGIAQGGLARHAGMRGQAYARRHGPMFAGGRLHRRQILHIVWKNDAGHAAPLQGDAHGAVDHVARLFGGRGHLHVIVRHVLEQADQVDFLLVVAAQGAAGLLADQGHDGLMVQLGVVQAIQQMDGAGTGGRQADPGLPGELGVGAGHERRGFFVAGLDELQRLTGAAEGADQAVDTVSGVAVDPSDPPLRQPFQHKVRHSLHSMLRVFPQFDRTPRPAITVPGRVRLRRCRRRHGACG